MLKIFLLVFISLIFLKCAGTTDLPEYNYAVNAYNNGEYRTAITYLDSVIRIGNPKSEYYTLRAKANYQIGNKSTALDDLNKSLELEKSFSAYYTRGKIFLEQNDTENAKHDFRNAYETNPNNADLLFDLAYLEFSRGENQLALEYYLKSVEVDSTNPAAFVNIGNLYATMGNSNLAVDNYSIAIAIDSTNVIAYFNRANEKLLLGDYFGAVEDYENSLLYDSLNINTHLIAAELKYKLDNYNGAIDHYSRIVQIDSTYAKAYYLKAVAEISLAKKDKACNDFRKAGDLGYFDAYEMIRKYCSVSDPPQKKNATKKKKR